MQVLCGCGASFKRSGIRIHQQRSDDPRCKKKFRDPGRKLDNSENQPEIESDQDMASETETIGADEIEWKDFEVDPKGDFFGDYDDYTPEEFGLDPQEESEEGATNKSDADSDEEDVEDPLEPSRIPRTSESTPIRVIDEAESDTTPTPGAS
jgi:hypothetical protein